MGEMTKDLDALVKNWKFSRNALELQSSIIREILKDSSKPGVINFGGGLPAPELFPVDKIKQACIDVMDKHATAALQYGLTTGVQSLRELIASRMRKQGAEVSTECIQITGGAQQGLDIVGRVFLENDAVVLTETPTYLGALQAFSFYRPKFVSVETDEEGIIPDDVEEKMRKYKPRFIYVVANFQNPTGGCISERRRLALVEAARKYACPIIDDNPYGELRFSGKNLPALKSIGPDAVIELGTFSKIISPGLRIGWICSMPSVQTLFERMKQACDLHTNSFTQYVICEFAAAGHLDPHIELIRKAYSERRNVMVNMMKEHFPKGTAWTEPEGGLFLWVKAPGNVSTSKLLPDAIKAGIAYVPGKYFYSEKADDTTLRLNFCNATLKNIEEGIKRLGKVIASAN
jgi:2-aminoadipate transaminase